MKLIDRQRDLRIQVNEWVGTALLLSLASPRPAPRPEPDVDELDDEAAVAAAYREQQRDPADLISRAA